MSLMTHLTATLAMKFAVETWAPDYGSPTDEAALAATDEVVDATAEVPLVDWATAHASARLGGHRSGRGRVRRRRPPSRCAGLGHGC